MTVSARPVPAYDRPSTARLLAALLVQERRLARSAYVVAGVALTAIALVALFADEAAALHRDSLAISMATFPAAAATLLATNAAMLRPELYDANDLLHVHPVSSTMRTISVALSSAWVAAIVLVVELTAVGTLQALGAIGGPVVLDLLLGPAVVMTGGALGLALARWFPSAAAAPLTLAGAVIVVSILTRRGLWSVAAAYGPARRPDGTLEWVTVPFAGNFDVLGRSAAAHLLLLVLLAAGATVVALLRDSRRWPVLGAGAVVAIGLGAAIGLATARLASTPQAPDLVCETDTSVTYCAYAPYREWIEEWRLAVDGVLESVPEPHPATSLSVRQTLGQPQRNAPEDLQELGRADVLLPTRWARGAALGDAELQLALQIAAWTVGLPTDLIPRDGLFDGLPDGVEIESPEQPTSDLTPCDAANQGRAVVALWLAANATPRTSDALHRLVSSTNEQWLPTYGTPFTVVEPIWWSTQDTRAALQLPSPEVAPLRDRIWPEATGASATSATAVELLGGNGPANSPGPGRTSEPDDVGIPACP